MQVINLFIPQARTVKSISPSAIIPLVSTRDLVTREVTSLSTSHLVCFRTSPTALLGAMNVTASLDLLASDFF